MTPVLGFIPMQEPAAQTSPFFVIGIQLLGIILIVYFLFIRPQRKEQERHQEMVAELKRGDDVVTSGGIVGKIVKAEERTLIIQTGEARIQVERHRVARKVTKDATPEES